MQESRFFGMMGAEEIMLNVNEYFDGRVKSIGLTNKEGRATVGVMAPGDYEFGTATKEIMKVVSGHLRVQLPGETAWKDFSAGEEFVVAPNAKFKLQVAQDTAYLCFYE